MTLDSSGINKDGPGKFRTESNKLDFQSYYFNVANDEQSYNELITQCINSSKTDDRIQFKIIHLKSKTNSEETFDATKELRDLNKNNSAGTSADNKKRARTIFGTSYGDAKTSGQSGSGTKSRARAKSDFFLEDDFDCGQKQQQQQQHFIPKKTIRRCLSRRKKRYSLRKVKLRNFLTNISCNRLKQIDFDSAVFIIDYFTYILFNMNLFFLEEKFDN